jgi:ketosteroid isomerase-like protein
MTSNSKVERFVEPGDLIFLDAKKYNNSNITNDGYFIVVSVIPYEYRYTSIYTLREMYIVNLNSNPFCDEDSTELIFGPDQINRSIFILNP